MKTILLVRNIMEAGVRYVPTFAWLFALPFSGGINLGEFVGYLSFASMFLTISNVGFDRAILVEVQGHRLAIKSIIYLQLMRISVCCLGFALLFFINGSGYTFSIMLATIICICQSLECGDWFLRAQNQEKLLLVVKMLIISIFIPILIICFIFENWYVYHFLYCAMIFLMGVIPLGLYIFFSGITSYNSDSSSTSFLLDLKRLLIIGKDFYISGAVNLSFRRITPALMERGGSSEFVVYIFFLAMRALDALTPAFVAVTNFLYKRWSVMSSSDVYTEYFKLQAKIFTGCILLNACWFFVILCGESLVSFTPLLFIVSLVVLLNQRNPYFLSIGKTFGIIWLNVVSGLICIVIYLSNTVESVSSGENIYPLFLLTSLIFTQFHIICIEKRGR